MMEASAQIRKPPVALIVDDDPTVVKFLRDRCVKMGVEVRQASNGLQALIMARRDPPDVLIVDLHLPELDGLSLCSRLVQPDQAAIDVIAVSGYSSPEIYERCDSLGIIYAPKGPALWATVQSSLNRIFPHTSVTIEEHGEKTPAAVRERPLILVIDDDADVANFITSRLRKCGVDTVIASDGMQGYRIAAREKPNVIISDYFMPVADINFLLWRLRSTPSIEATPLFAMTGRDLDNVTQENLIRGSFGQRGVEQIFKKPLNIEQLFGALQKYCALEYKGTGRLAGLASI